MSYPTTTAGLPFVSDSGLSVMASAAHEHQQATGRTVVVGGRQSAAARKLERDGYLHQVWPGQYALTDQGLHWASVYGEAKRLLKEYADAIRHPDSERDGVNPVAYAAYLGRVDGFGNLAAAAFMALYPGLSWDNARSWACEAACDFVSVIRIAQHYGEAARR